MSIFFGYPYRQQGDVAEFFGLGKTTVYERVKEIKGEIGKRYNEHAVIQDGNIVLVNILVFVDYMTYRRRLRDKNMRKYVPEYDAKLVARQMAIDPVIMMKELAG